jgi:hypothetical protein
LQDDPFKEIARSLAEEIHANYEKRCVQDAGYQYPSPQFMFDNKPVCLKIGLYGNDHFFQQNGGVWVCKVIIFTKFNLMKAITLANSDKLPSF